MTKKAYGFTIVELLIVIVVIGILASMAIVSYTGIQSRARDTLRQSSIMQVQRLIEVYHANNGEYPKTADDITEYGPTVVRTDSNCHVGTKQADWVPGLTEALPPSLPTPGKGAFGDGTAIDQQGFFFQAKDGIRYILSAWNNLESGPQTTTMYRRLGFREPRFAGNNTYLCNFQYIGGTNESLVYQPQSDYYKRSYTISNITDCDETPPAGA